MELDADTEYGGFWIRVGAAVIDSVTLIIPSLLISALTRLESLPGAEAFAFIYQVSLWWVYSAVLHSSTWQATIGKKALGMKVVDYSGERISFGRATGRHFASFLSALILGIGVMMVGWTNRKQALHDFMANTLVVKVKNVWPNALTPSRTSSFNEVWSSHISSKLLYGNREVMETEA